MNTAEKTIGGAARLGYKKDGDKDNIEQEIIQLVIKLRYEDNFSHSAIARVLNERGYKNRRWNDFTPDNVSHVINYVIPRFTGKPNHKRRSAKNPSYGKMWSPDNEEIDNPYEKRILEKAISLRGQRMSYQKISEQLAAEGFVNRAGEPVNKGNVNHWFSSCIPNMLNGNNDEQK